MPMQNTTQQSLYKQLLKVLNLGAQTTCGPTAVKTCTPANMVQEATLAHSQYDTGGVEAACQCLCIGSRCQLVIAPMNDQHREASCGGQDTTRRTDEHPGAIALAFLLLAGCCPKIIQLAD